MALRGQCSRIARALRRHCGRSACAWFWALVTCCRSTPRVVANCFCLLDLRATDALQLGVAEPTVLVAALELVSDYQPVTFLHLHCARNACALLHAVRHAAVVPLEHQQADVDPALSRRHVADRRCPFLRVQGKPMHDSAFRPPCSGQMKSRGDSGERVRADPLPPRLGC